MAGRNYKPLYWAEINLDKLEGNYRTLSTLGGEAREVISVIKSNAYGHGIEEVARHLYGLGARKFAVSCLDEAIAVDECLGDGSKAEVLILGYTPPMMADELRERSIIQSVSSASYARDLLAASGAPMKVHIKLDTGMHRRGIHVGAGDFGEAEIKEIISMHSVEGIYTHLHSADGADEMSHAITNAQIALFKGATEALPDGITRHCLNSAGSINYITAVPRELSRVIRPGIALYGVSPSSEVMMPEGFSPALGLYTVVVEIKDICPGESIGYGASYTATEKMRIAILPIGYGEGYRRSLSGEGKVLIGDRLCPIVGRICMNMTAVDITEVGSVSVGDTATLIGGELNATTLGEMSGTIGYDILSSISKDIKRIYI